MKHLFLFVLYLIISCYSRAANLAFLVENLPSTDHMSLINAIDANDAILNAIDKYKIPAMGFVNESRIHVDSNFENRIAILKKWLNSGHELGNQGYTNKSYNLVPDDEYFAEITKGENLLRSLMRQYNMKLRYFIPPYLHLGTNPRSYNNLLAFLRSKGYELVPVTITNDDWLFNRDYIKAIEMQDTELADTIKQRYIQFTHDRFVFYTEASRKLFGYMIDQVFLIHLNKINEDAIDEILKIPVKLGYHYSKLEQVLSGFPYNDIKYHAFSKSGISWFRKFDDIEGKVLDWKKEPQNEKYLDDLFVSH
jgi:peptidoglycan/xylan/chitin deacetylase (PgdA/CDA1 family)